jgi:hydroxyacylglutathione hydrolase
MPAPSLLEIVAVPAFSDNYIWLVHDPASGETAAVDPGDAAPALAEAERRGWTISQVWNTHWHPDHTGGNIAAKQAATERGGGCTVSGPGVRPIAGVDVTLAEGDEIRIGAFVGTVWAIPGHTLDHLALVFERERVAFVGDTLFAMGCGRLFEGTAEQMHASLQRLASLPEGTALYCGHEYTLANAKFAQAAEPNNPAIAARLDAVAKQRSEGKITLPTTVAEERATNPFVRASDARELARLRTAKDSFR